MLFTVACFGMYEQLALSCLCAVDQLHTWPRQQIQQEAKGEHAADEDKAAPKPRGLWVEDLKQVGCTGFGFRFGTWESNISKILM